MYKRIFFILIFFLFTTLLTACDFNSSYDSASSEDKSKYDDAYKSRDGSKCASIGSTELKNKPKDNIKIIKITFFIILLNYFFILRVYNHSIKLSC